MKVHRTEILLVEWDEDESVEEREEQGKRLIAAGYTFWTMIAHVDHEHDVSRNRYRLFIRPGPELVYFGEP